MPAAAVPSGIAQLESLLTDQLAAARLEHGAVEVSGTVRRLVARVQDLAPAQTSQTTERRGPSVKIAFDADGAPTRAAIGFARGQGLPVSKLEVRGEHVHAVRTEAGKPAVEVLPDVLGDRVGRIRLGPRDAVGRIRQGIHPPGAVASGVVGRFPGAVFLGRVDRRGCHAGAALAGTWGCEDPGCGLHGTRGRAAGLA